MSSRVVIETEEQTNHSVMAKHEMDDLARGVIERERAKKLYNNVPLLPLLFFLLLLLALAQVEGHHPPGQVLHALLVRELLLGLAEELPDLGGQGILALHLLDAARGPGAGLEGREQRGVEHMVF